jgi:hypothetical protein
MARKMMDAQLVSLVRGEGGAFWPTRSERRLLKFALDRFGEMLTRFLLTGYGEANVAPWCKFSITFTGEDGTLQKRRLQTITHEAADGSSRFPRGRDPLVLLALLRLLLDDPWRENDLLIFREAAVFQLLGWEDTPEHLAEIDEAIRRYHQLTYIWEMNASELARNDLDEYEAAESLIAGHRTRGNRTKEGRVERIYNGVTFGVGIVDSLVQRLLFEVPWDKVKSIKLAPGSKRRKEENEL